MNQYHVWNKWNKLKTVVLGDSYHSEFFGDIKNTKIRSALQRISDETQEDLEHYEKVLKDFGCNVIRPHVDSSDNIMNYINVNNQLKITSVNTVPRGPLQVRDNQFVAGNKLFAVTDHEKPIIDCLLNYNAHDVIFLNKLEIDDHKTIRHWDEHKFNSIKGDSWKTFSEYKNNPKYFNELPKNIKQEIMMLHEHSSYNYIDAPSHTLIGRDLYVDEKNTKLHSYQEKKLLNNISNVRINKLNVGGHNDSCFSILKPGVILSLNEIQKYNDTFPNWDVCYLPDASFDAIPEFMKLKNQVNGKWWVPGEEENDEFTHFVETWLQDWVGYVEETVFDVNVLSLDEHHVCVNNLNNKQINEFLKKHKIEPVHVPWRHRYFYDGGLHCITLDLEREGSQEDYFPERGDTGVIDHGFD